MGTTNGNHALVCLLCCCMAGASDENLRLAAVRQKRNAASGRRGNHVDKTLIIVLMQIKHDLRRVCGRL